MIQPNAKTWDELVTIPKTTTVDPSASPSQAIHFW
jgi:hypothetical protein